VSSNSCIATSADGMITDLPWRVYDRLRHYLTEYKDGLRVAISAALPLMASLAVSSNPGDPNLLVLDANPAHACVRFDKNTKILNPGSERISRYVISYAIRSCKIGLVMGNDAKTALLKDMLTKMGTLELITSMLDLFLFLKDAPNRQRYFGPFATLKESFLWQVRTKMEPRISPNLVMPLVY